MAKKDQKKPDALLTKRLITALLLFALLSITAWAVSPITVRMRQERELVALTQKHRAVRRENRLVRQEISKLKHDEGYWETLARQNMGYVKSDEEAYVVSQKPARRQAAPKQESAAGPWSTVVKRLKALALMF